MNITFLALLILTTFSCVYLHFGANASLGASKGGRDLLWESRKKPFLPAKMPTLMDVTLLKGTGASQCRVLVRRSRREKSITHCQAQNA